uniref:GNAT family N-acetyltransferase n=1 Tax=Stappia sp. TaxID=1870903 RepID=UPI003BAA303F
MRTLRSAPQAGVPVFLRPPLAQDYVPWAALRAESRDFLQPWEPLWARDELTRGAFRRRLRRYAREQREDRAYPFFVFRESDGELLGGATLSNVRRGVAMACTLGYWMGAPHAGKGYMSAAVSLLLPFAFGELRLNRVEAACLPTNSASRRLLEKAGFQREGYARRYLRIAGEWRDHVLYACVAGDVEARVTGCLSPVTSHALPSVPGDEPGPPGDLL